MPSRKLREWQQRQSDRARSAAELARRLEEADRLAEAERAILDADDSIQGRVAVAAMYRQRLTRLAAQTDRRAAEDAFRRARDWARSALPEPHTADEAAQFASAEAEAIADLVRILGYEPA